MKKALILNEFLSDNLGDQAIGKSMSEFLEKKGYETVSVYLSQPSKTELSLKDEKKIRSNVRINSLKSILYILVFHYRYKSIIIKHLNEIAPDVVIVGGGQLINSSKQNRLSGFSISLFWWTRLIRKYSASIEICTIGIGVASNFGLIEKALYQSALNRIDRFYVRDVSSMKSLRWNFNKISKVTPDIAFYTKHHELENCKRSELLLGIANYEEVFLRYNSYISREEYWEDVLDKSTFRNSLSEVKLFYTTDKDIEEVRLFREYLISKYKISIEILPSHSLKQLVQVIKRGRVLSSGRMHALILGMKYDNVVVPYPISSKLKSFDSEYANKFNAQDLSKIISESIEI